MSRSLGLAKVTLKIIHIIEVAISFWWFRIGGSLKVERLRFSGLVYVYIHLCLCL